MHFESCDFHCLWLANFFVSFSNRSLIGDAFKSCTIWIIVGEKKSWFFNIDVDNITNIYLTASQIKSHIYNSFACDFLGNSNLISSTILRWSGCILSHHVNEFSICRYGRKRKMHKINERFATNSMAKRKQINQQAEKTRKELALR